MAVCHHGGEPLSSSIKSLFFKMTDLEKGAGTTAIGLKLGRPTIVVPFFGDQKFWGNHVHSAGAGPAPIPYKHLSKELLASAFMYVSSDQAKEAAAEIALGINEEHGELKGVESFHRNMPLLKMR
jgi:UDP:flavonoid glycosyltransferase YjiC (YdhE family)